MKNCTGFIIAVLCFALLTAYTIANEVELDSRMLNDFEEFEERILVKDPGPPVDPNEPIVTSGDCSDFTDLSGMPLPIEVSGTTIGASNDYGPFSGRPACWRGGWDTPNQAQICAGPDVTYKWTAPDDGDYTISLCGSYFDNCLLLYRFTCPNEPVHPDDYICGADDNCYLRAKIRYVHLSQGEEIMIVVDGYGNNADNFELRIFKTLIDDMDWFMETQIETFHIPGAAACIVKDGQIDWAGYYGYANLEDSLEVADSTLFTLASISKTITVAALMQLWEDGLFGLDDDVNDYLPFSVRNPDTAYSSVPITFRSLLAHMSSINDYWSTLWSLESHGGDSPIALADFLEDYLTPLGGYFDPDNNFNDWAPETGFDYCNVGVALAGYLVELINPDSLSFSEYCQQNIFAPLGMNDAAWFLSELNIDNLAMPYDWNGSYQTPYGQFGHPWYPAGLLRTSAPTLTRHLIAFMQHGQLDGVRILDSTTCDLMTTVHYPGINDRRGLVWYWTYFGIRPVWGHGGSFPGLRTRMFYYPEENTGVIVLTNGEASDGMNAMVAHLFEYSAGPSANITGTVEDIWSNPIDNVYAKVIGLSRFDYSNADGDYFVGGLISGTYDIKFVHHDYPETTITGIDLVIGDTAYVNVEMKPLHFPYLPGDVNMYDGAWPPTVIGGDVTYLVSYFRGMISSQPCRLDGFWCAADANGDCTVIGSDVTRLVNYFRGIINLNYCPDYSPAWESPEYLPEEPPPGWPNCE
jgi:CubicO group peptidase (beta-lactamase class C family)